jgi:hypothetical protein
MTQAAPVFVTLEFLTAAAPATDVAAIERLAVELRDAINAEASVLVRIAAAHVPSRDASGVQEAVAAVLLASGFEFEKQGLFRDVEVPGLRPDLFHEGLGILGEFERGGPLTNNRDLLDFYKVHICAQARHLFLFLPQTIHGRSASLASAKRMRAVLREQSAVDSVAVFGY